MGHLAICIPVTPPPPLVVIISPLMIPWCDSGMLLRDLYVKKYLWQMELSSNDLHWRSLVYFCCYSVPDKYFTWSTWPKKAPPPLPSINRGTMGQNISIESCKGVKYKVTRQDLILYPDSYTSRLAAQQPLVSWQSFSLVARGKAPCFLFCTSLETTVHYTTVLHCIAL